MEKNLAILMADLSGYTALTETHGAVAAADLIDKYIDIVQNCLTGDCQLHDRTGDEVMIVSSSPDHLLTTALEIGKLTSNEENFLQIHGGLHYGKVLERTNSYFGNAINLTSRIASKASAGKVWCSDDFVNALSDKSAFALESKGNHFFKNISVVTGVFELSLESRKSYHIDPVCKMILGNGNKNSKYFSKDGHYFCSSECLAIYNAN